MSHLEDLETFGNAASLVLSPWQSSGYLYNGPLSVSSQECAVGKEQTSELQTTKSTAGTLSRGNRFIC